MLTSILPHIGVECRLRGPFPVNMLSAPLNGISTFVGAAALGTVVVTLAVQALYRMYQKNPEARIYSINVVDPAAHGSDELAVKTFEFKPGVTVQLVYRKLPLETVPFQGSYTHPGPVHLWDQHNLQFDHDDISVGSKKMLVNMEHAEEDLHDLSTDTLEELNLVPPND